MAGKPSRRIQKHNLPKKTRYLTEHIHTSRVARTGGAFLSPLVATIPLARGGYSFIPFPNPVGLLSYLKGRSQTQKKYRQLATEIKNNPALYETLKDYKFVLVNRKGELVGTNKRKFLAIFGRKRLSQNTIATSNTPIENSYKLLGSTVKSARDARTAGLINFITFGDPIAFWSFIRGTGAIRRKYRDIADELRKSNHPQIIDILQNSKFVLVNRKGEIVGMNRRKLLWILGRKRLKTKHILTERG